MIDVNDVNIEVILLVACPVIPFMFDTILSTLPCFAIILIGTFNDDLSDSAIKFKPYNPNSESLGNEING